MPSRPLAACPHQPCPELTPGGPCPAHQAARERERGSAHARGYDRLWQQLRDQVLAGEPLCRSCRATGRVEAATDVDHIKARRRFPPHLRRSMEPGGADHRDNLQPLCKSHHSAKTRQEMASKGER